MIEVTSEMREAFLDAGTQRGYGGQLEDLDAGLAAVLALVVRDWNVQPNPAAPARSRVEPEGLRDSLGTTCASCGHPRNFHEYSDLRCTVKLDQHGFARCGCAYRTPYADQAASITGS